MFDEVQGIYVPRAEHERRVKFNSDDYKSTKDEIRRFPSPLTKPELPDSTLDYISAHPTGLGPTAPTLRHPKFYAHQRTKNE